MFMDTKNKRLVHNYSTGEIKEEELSIEEVAYIKEKEEEFIAKLEQIEIDKATSATRRAALLERLGITEEEAKLLLG